MLPLLHGKASGWGATAGAGGAGAAAAAAARRQPQRCAAHLQRKPPGQVCRGQPQVRPAVTGRSKSRSRAARPGGTWCVCVLGPVGKQCMTQVGKAFFDEVNTTQANKEREGVQQHCGRTRKGATPIRPGDSCWDAAPLVLSSLLHTPRQTSPPKPPSRGPLPCSLPACPASPCCVGTAALGLLAPAESCCTERDRQSLRPLEGHGVHPCCQQSPGTPRSPCCQGQAGSKQAQKALASRNSKG